MPLPINVAVTSDAGIAITTGPFDDTTSSWTVTPEGTARGRLGAIGDELATWGFDPKVGAGFSVGPAGRYATVEVGPTGHMVTLGDGAVIAGAGDNGWSFALGRGDVVGMRVTPTEGVYFELGGGMFNLLLRPDGHVEMLPLRTAGTAAGGSAASPAALAGLREAGVGGGGGAAGATSAARRAGASSAAAVIPGGDASKATRLPGRVVGGRVGAGAARPTAPKAANNKKKTENGPGGGIGSSSSNLRSGNALVNALYSGDPDKQQLQQRLDRVGAVLKGLVGMAAGGAAKAAAAAQGLQAPKAGAGVGVGAAAARRSGTPVFLPAPSTRGGGGGSNIGGSSSGLRVPAQGAVAQAEAAAAAAMTAAAPSPAPPPQPAASSACPEGSVARVSAATGRTVCRARRAQQQQQQQQRYDDDGGDERQWQRPAQQRGQRQQRGQLQQRGREYDDYDPPGGRWQGGGGRVSAADYDYEAAPPPRRNGGGGGGAWRRQQRWDSADYDAAAADEGQQPQRSRPAPTATAPRRSGGSSGRMEEASPASAPLQQAAQEPQYETVSYYAGAGAGRERDGL
jgi:hypothetical protein